MLFPDRERLQALSAAVREVLHHDTAGRDWNGKRVELDAEDFENFHPLINADGVVTALRFIFTPYVLGSWADSIWIADVPISVPYPHLAEEYRDLFVVPEAAMDVKP